MALSIVCVHYNLVMDRLHCEGCSALYVFCELSFDSRELFTFDYDPLGRGEVEN